MRLLLFVILLVGCKAKPPSSSSEGILWEQVESNAVIPDTNIQHPNKALYYNLSENIFKKLSKSGVSEEESIEINIPNPDGELVQFKVWDAGIIAPELAKKFPFLKTFKGYEIANPSNRLRLETPSGIFTAQIIGDKPWLISPYSRENQVYIVYLLSELPEKEKDFWEGKIK